MTSKILLPKTKPSLVLAIPTGVGHTNVVAPRRKGRISLQILSCLLVSMFSKQMIVKLVLIQLITCPNNET